MPNSYQWRAFVGPAYEPSTSAYTFDHVAFAAANNPTAAVTTLSSSLDAGATSAALTSAASFPTRGGLWIGPTAAGQSWEYVSYSGKSTNTLTGLRREAATTREHNGTHGAGAVARQWYPITTNDGRFHLTEELDPALACITWSAEIAGYLAPQQVIRPGHLIAIQYRTDTAGAWSLYALGFTDQPRIKDDYQRRRQWTLKIVSLAAIAAGYTAPPVRSGALNLATAGSARSSTPLAMPTKEALSGDFGEADPDLSAGSAIDDDPASLWIAEAYRGTALSRQYPRNESPLRPGRFICAARIARWPGEAKGYRYLELLTPDAPYSNVILNGYICCKTQSAATPINFDGLSTSPGQVIAIVENLAKYQEANPLANPASTFEIGAPFFDALSLAGDAIAIFSEAWSATIAWGTGGQPKRIGSTDYGTAWTTNTIPAPGPGQIIKYRYWPGVTLDTNYFIVDYTDWGGYTPLDVNDPWIQVDLPRLNLSIRDDITASSPAAGARLYLNKANSASTEGLLSSGTLQIGLEQISYSARFADGVTVSARAANGTTAATHKAGDAIRVIDTDGTATEGYLVSRIEWSRNGRSPYPSEFTIRRSNADSARVPEDDNHTDDYETLASVAGHVATSYSLTLSPSRRSTVIIMEIDKMSDDPSRPRLNTLKIIADTAQYDSAYVMPDGTTAGALIAQILTNAGLPSSAIITNAGTLATGTLTTAAGESAWSVAADLAAKASTLISVGRTGTITISANSLPGGSLAPTFTASEVTAAAVEMAQASAKPYGQASQAYILPDGTKGVARYPTETPAGNLPPLELAEARFTTAAAALDAVRRSYILARYPIQFVIELAEPAPDLRPGTAVTFTWQFADDMQPVSRTGIVMAADHEIQGAAATATTVITLAQIDREANA